MKIESCYLGYTKKEEQYVTVVDINENLQITLASYVYDGVLSERETDASFWNAALFRELDKKLRNDIINLVNITVNKKL